MLQTSLLLTFLLYETHIQTVNKNEATLLIMTGNHTEYIKVQNK